MGKRIIFAIVSLMIVFTLFACQKINIDENGHEHTYSEWIEEVDSTCSQYGVKGHYECVECGKCFDKDHKNITNVVISKKNHVVVTDPAVNPTCTTDGKTEGLHCSICGEVIVAQEKVDKLGHTPDTPVKENVVAPTCTEAGSHDEVTYCKTCHIELKRETKVDAALGHTEVTIPGKAATCTATGKQAYYTCTVDGCGQHFSDEAGQLVIEDLETWGIIEKAAHTLVDIAAIPATCTEKGYTAGKKCSVCNEVVEAPTEVAALGHDLKANGTYVIDGDNIYPNLKCSRCDHQEQSQTAGSIVDVATAYAAAEALPNNEFSESVYYVRGLATSVNKNSDGTYTIWLKNGDEDKAFQLYHGALVGNLENVYAGDTVVIAGYLNKLFWLRIKAWYFQC